IIPYDIDFFINTLYKLKPESKAEWGIMTPQHLVEHLHYFNRLMLGEEEAELAIPEEHVEKYQESLWTYKPMPKHYQHPLLKKGETEDVKFEDLDAAREALVGSI